MLSLNICKIKVKPKLTTTCLQQPLFLESRFLQLENKGTSEQRPSSTMAVVVYRFDYTSKLKFSLRCRFLYLGNSMIKSLLFWEANCGTSVLCWSLEFFLNWESTWNFNASNKKLDEPHLILPNYLICILYLSPDILNLACNQIESCTFYT